MAPVTIFAIAAAAGTGISAIASYSAYQQQAKVAESNADAASAAARAEEQRLRRDRARRMGSIRAAYGAAGVQATGTPLEVLGDQAMEAELDALAVRYGGAVRSRNFENQADSNRSSAIGSLIGGAAGVGTSLLGSAQAGAFKKSPGTSSDFYVPEAQHGSLY